MNADKYPYFIYPMVDELRNGDISEERRAALRARIALNIGDSEALRVLLGLDPEEFNIFYTDMLTPSPSTDDTIDTFLSTYSRGPLPDEIPLAPAIDYASTLEQTPPAATYTDPEPLQDATISETESEPDIASENAGENIINPSQNLSESLAKVMIKNHNYTKALEIIMELSLNNPQKSVYFADQIRFLRKLIYAQSRHKQSN